MSYKNIVAAIGKYEKDGTTKYVNRTIGKMVETQYGPKLVIDACFLSGFIADDQGGVWCSMFDPQPRGEAKQAPQSSAQGFPDDEPPF